MIESAIARPLNQWEYAEERDIPALAAAYGFGLVRNHGYVDGNKRVGFVAMAVFLEINGYILNAPESEAVRIMLGVAAGETGEAELAAWLRTYSQPQT
jgi:death-on-curing protein